MERNEVINEIVETVKRKTGMENITFQQCTKNNGVDKYGIGFPISKGVFATVYIADGIIERAMSGDITPEDIADDLIRQFNSRKKGLVEEMKQKDLFEDFLFNKEKLLENIRCAVINRHKNRHLRETIPFKDIFDLMVVYRIFFDANSSSLLTYQIMEQAGVTIEEVEEAAHRNTHDLYQMDYILNIMYKMRGQEPPYIPSDSPFAGMRVITTDQMNYGASAIADKDYLEVISKSYGNKDFIIIPSSINEIITIPADEELDTDAILSMVRSVNATEVNPTDFLSDSIYRYVVKDRNLVMIE